MIGDNKESAWVLPWLETAWRHPKVMIVHLPAESPVPTTDVPLPPVADSMPEAGIVPISYRPLPAGPVPDASSAPEQAFSAFGSINQFKDAQRMANLLVHCSIVPENYRGEEHLGDAVIALEIANRIGASILAVMQNLRLVQGKPGWSSQFLISCVNASKRFSPIRYQMTGIAGQDSQGCIAWATDKSGQVLKSPEVTIKMAKEEGWYYRPGSKWKAMPGLMLCYRSATLFTRLYAPEITMGIQTTEEVVEMGPDNNGQAGRPVFETERATPKCAPLSKKEEAQTPGQAQGPSPRSGGNGSDSGASASIVLKVATEPLVSPCKFLKALTGLIHLSRHSEDEVMRFLRNTRKCDESLRSLAEVAEKQPEAIIWAHETWKSVDQELTRLKKEQPL